jgi:polyhydroxyalkanoate synthesis regulator phasin
MKIIERSSRMKKDFLTGFGLSDDEAKQILDKVSEEITAAKQPLETKNSSLQQQLDAANETLKGYNGVDVEGYKTKIAEYDKTIEALKAESAAKLKAIVVDNAITSKLSAVPEKYRKLIEGQIDREKLTVGDDNTVTGLDEQYLKLKEDYSDLFESNAEPIKFGYGGTGVSQMTATNDTLAGIFGVKTE